jgi:hypothetical protein
MARRSSQPAFTDSSVDAEVAQYRPFCGLAVVAAALGLLSALALWAPLFWFLPVLGVVLAAVALRRIAAADPPPVGRTAALLGLGLSLVFAAAATTDFYYYRWTLRQEARQFGLLWLDLLTSGQPEKACQAMEPAAFRQPLDDKLWASYPSGSDERQKLEGFVGWRAVHALLLLRDRATVRYYDTEKQWTANDRDYVAQSFAVTYLSAEGEKETFFVRLIMERSPLERKRQAFWRVARAEGDIMPVALGGEPPATGG